MARKLSVGYCSPFTLCLNLPEVEKEFLNVKWMVCIYVSQISSGTKCQQHCKLAEAFTGSCDPVHCWGRFQDATTSTNVSILVLFLCIGLVLSCYRLVSYIEQTEVGRSMAVDNSRCRAYLLGTQRKERFSFSLCISTFQGRTLILAQLAETLMSEVLSKCLVRLGSYARSVAKGGKVPSKEWSCHGLKKGRKNASHRNIRYSLISVIGAE